MYKTKIICDKKTGYLSNDRVICIYDKNDKPFYAKANLERTLYFNLPSGVYYTNNDLKESSEPRFFKLYQLPFSNAKKKLPNVFKIYFTENPNKCSVDINAAVIYFDNSFKDVSESDLMYVKLHELGHFFYSGLGQESEKCCDWFAYNNMIGLGYNPSQVYASIKNTLSNRPDALIRKNFTYNLAKNSI